MVWARSRASRGPAVSYRLVIEYRTPTGTHQRVVYQPDSAGLGWLRREDVYDPESDEWRTRGREQIQAPTLTVEPTRGRSFSGP